MQQTAGPERGQPVRINRHLHRKLKIVAAEKGTTIRQLIEAACAYASQTDKSYRFDDGGKR